MYSHTVNSYPFFISLSTHVQFFKRTFDSQSQGNEVQNRNGKASLFPESEERESAALYRATIIKFHMYKSEEFIHQQVKLARIQFR